MHPLAPWAAIIHTAVYSQSWAGKTDPSVIIRSDEERPVPVGRSVELLKKLLGKLVSLMKGLQNHGNKEGAFYPVRWHRLSRWVALFTICHDTCPLSSNSAREAFALSNPQSDIPYAFASYGN